MIATVTIGCLIWSGDERTREMSKKCCSTRRRKTATGYALGLADPGQAGKSQAQHLVRALSNFTVMSMPESGDKITRFGPFSSQCRAGNVKIKRANWNEELFRVLEGFPDLAHDDEVDACSGAYELHNPKMKGWGAFEAMRQRAEEIAQKQAGETGQQRKPPPQTVYQPGSMEWQAAQKRSS